MINFKDRDDVIPSVLILAALLIMFGALMVMIFLPKPSTAGLATLNAKKVAGLQDTISHAKQVTADGKSAIAPRLWTGNTDKISASVLAQITAAAQGQQLTVSAFRPQRLVDLGELSEMPFTVQVSGSYGGIHSIMTGLDTANSKIVLTSAQIASAQTSGAAVTATLGLAIFIPADQSLVPPPPSPSKPAKSESAPKTKEAVKHHG